MLIMPTPADGRREKFFAELAKSKDWFAVMQKYFVQDDAEFRKEVVKKTSAAFQKNLLEILTPLRQNFPKKFLVVSSVRDADAQDFLTNFFVENIKKCAFYFLQPKDSGQFICRENFSGAIFDLKTAEALTEFVKNYNLTRVYVEKPLNFGDNTAAINEWLKTCELPVKLFAQKTN